MRADTPELFMVEPVVGPRLLPPEPPPELTPVSFAERLYAALGPLAQDDPDVGWALLIYVNAISRMFQLVDDWARDTPDGPGFSLLMDLNRTPFEALGWLAQFAGVRIPPGLSEEEARQWVAGTDGFHRGTREALVAAARATLVGRQLVVFRERDGAAYGDATSPNYAYHLTVNTYTDQTPDSAATLLALMGQKPAGIILHYSTIAGQTFAVLRDTPLGGQTTPPTFADVKANYANFAAVRAGQVE